VNRLRTPLQNGPCLVRLPSWLGDLVAVEPALRALAGELGEEQLSLAGPEHLLPLLEGTLPGARRIVHRGRGGERARDWRGHHTAVLFTGSFRSAFTALAAGIPRRVGWARDGRGWLLTDALAPAREVGRNPLGRAVRGRWPRYLPRPVTATAIELLALLGIPVSDPVPRLAPAPALRERAHAQLGGDCRSYLLANVGGRADSAKTLAPERWAALLAPLARELALPVVLVAGPGEEAALERVHGALRAAGTAVRRAFDGRVADLPELAALCADAALVVTMDSGPRHVARAVGARTATLFGPTDPRHTLCAGPPELRLRLELDCAPCHRERCPLPGALHRRCTAGFEARETAARIAAWFGSSAG
jgi:heptosyltransferase-2